METIKSKSAAKVVIPKSNILEKKILSTMSTISKIVGGTLGPGGHPVLIERQEYNLPPLVTKDGVTVFRSLGFQDAVQHSIFEAIRDVSVRTAQEAGDGTTTAAILSESFVRHTTNYCKANPKIPPIKVIKIIQKLFHEVMIPTIKRLTLPCDLESEEGKKRLKSVAKLSANGDEELAEAVMKCFDITGDEGNVTIVESTGPSSIKTEKIEGFPVLSGFEESCGKFYPMFINDPATQRVVLEKPIFLLYFGRVNDIQTCLDILVKLQDGLSQNYLKTHNIVFFAVGFSESVLANLASIFIKGREINVLPVVIPKTAVLNSERHFLEDVAAITGAEIFDPLTKSLSDALFEDLGNLVKSEGIIKDASDNEIPVTVYEPMGVKFFECGRYRSSIIGHCDEEILLKHVENVKISVTNAESEYEKRQFQERLAKLSGGIARLTVIGSSNGELKERRDRAEDAVCAVRGAVEHGALIGGGWTLVRLAKELQEIESDTTTKEIVDKITNPSLLDTLGILFSNAGANPEEQDAKVGKSISKGDPKKAIVTDLSTGFTVNALEAGILDSAPAVQEALKNSIAGATLMGTLGGCVVFERNIDFEIKDGRDATEFERMAQSNMADERI